MDEVFFFVCLMKSPLLSPLNFGIDYDKLFFELIKLLKSTIQYSKLRREFRSNCVFHHQSQRICSSSTRALKCKKKRLERKQAGGTASRKAKYNNQPRKVKIETDNM